MEEENKVVEEFPQNDETDCSVGLPSQESMATLESAVSAPAVLEKTATPKKVSKKVVTKRSSTLFTATKSSTCKIKSRSCDNLSDTLNSSKKSAPKLTQPISPNLRVAKRSTSRPLPQSTEEIERQKQLAIIEAEKLRIAKAKKAFQRVRVKSSLVFKSAIRSTKQVTIPNTPKLKLTKRLGEKKCSIIGIDVPKMNFSEKPAPESTGPRGNTIVEPFHFATDSRITNNGPKAAVPTLGEAMTKFFSDPRSHEVPASACKQLTDARAPVFRTDIRLKNNSHPLPLSTEEREMQLLEEIRQHPFKAKPVDQRILQGQVDVPVKVAVKPLTQFQEFELRTNHRAETRKHEETAPDQFAFKALPMPDFSAAPISPAKEIRASFKPTVAISPKLAGGRRASMAPVARQKPHHALVEKQRAEEKAARERAARASICQMKITEPKEFHLQSDTRGLAHKAAFEERLKQEREAEERARNVKAMPISESINKPFFIKPSTKELTEFEIFQLRSIERHETAEQRFKDELKAEEERLAAEFKALPVPKTTYAPDFVVEVDDRSLVTPMDVKLESEVRAAKRREFDEMVAAQRTAAEKEKEDTERRQIEKENKEIKQLRRQTIDQGGLMFVAKPVVTTDLFPTKTPKTLPLTEPKSPFLRTKERANRVSVDDGSLANIDAF